MSFMQPQITDKQKWYIVDTSEGTQCVPLLHCGYIGPHEIEECADNGDTPDKLKDYIEGTFFGAELVVGYGARLAAHGYIDQTEWTVFNTVAQAARYLLDLYYDMDQPDEDEQNTIEQLEKLL